MNRGNINFATKRQFDTVLKKEGITLTDYYDNTEYVVFFRKTNRGTNPQGKVRIFYSQDTPINIGTTFLLKGNPYVVISRDGDESEVYYTSIAMKCDTSFTPYVDGEGYITVPFVTVSDKYTLQHNSTINLISGTANCYTGLNKYSQSVKIDDKYYNYGGYYKVGKRNLYKMKLENSMALDELVRLLEQKRMISKSIFKVGFKDATNQVIHVTFKYSSFTSTKKDDKDEKTGKLNKYRIKGYNKEKIRNLLYDKYNDDDFTFKMDGIEYVRWIRSGSTAREGNCLFINKALLNGMNAFTDCGIKPKKKKLNLASFEAYRALVLSIKIDDLEIKPENILVIDDVKSTFKERVMYTGTKTVKGDDGKDKEELITKEKDLEITNKIFDGQSLIDKSLMGKYQDKGMLLLRHKFFKSCCFNANIQQWFKDNNTY